MANKMTKRDYFAILRETFPIDHPQHDAVIAFIDHEVELLSKKNAKSGELSKKQVENKVLQDTILERMEVDKKYTITDIQKNVMPEYDLSNQKLTHLMTPLVEDGQLMRESIKRKAYFFKPVESEVEGD